MLTLALHRHELRRTILSLRRATPVAEAPPVTTAGPSAGCLAPAAAPDNELFSLPDGRRFVVYLPRARGTGPAPLVVGLHGWGDDALHFADWFPLHDHVAPEAFVVYPDAEGRWDVRAEGDVVFVARVVAAVAARHCIDTSRLYAFGFSWGGRLASNLACAGRTPFRAVALGDASYHGRTGPCAPTDVFVTVRTHDQDERPESGRDAADRWAATNRCEAKATPLAGAPTCAEHRSCATGKRVVLCEDAFFDPSWPKEWNHTVRTPYVELAARFFAGKL